MPAGKPAARPGLPSWRLPRLGAGLRWAHLCVWRKRGAAYKPQRATSSASISERSKVTSWKPHQRLSQLLTLDDFKSTQLSSPRGTPGDARPRLSSQGAECQVSQRYCSLFTVHSASGVPIAHLGRATCRSLRVEVGQGHNQSCGFLRVLGRRSGCRPLKAGSMTAGLQGGP